MSQAVRWAIVAGVTLLYWLWESQAEGNIRIDLFLFYPILVLTYVGLLWQPLRWKSLGLAAILMAVNFGFFLLSYDLFDKNVG